jgi:hypothetical protein
MNHRALALALKRKHFDVTRYLFFHEWISARFGGEDARVMTVLDISGLKLRGLNGHVLGLLAKSGEVMNNCVPQRVKRMVVVNAPFWFGSAASSIVHMLPEVRGGRG